MWGVGGTTLAESGYDSSTYEHVLRFTDVTTVSATLMHEARLSLKWVGETDTPTTNAPQVQVAGAFTGGGANLGDQRLRDLVIEADDDAIWNVGKHSLKFGTQLFIYNDRQRLTTNFNGTYTFGGGDAPVLDAEGQPGGGASGDDYGAGAVQAGAAWAGRGGRRPRSVMWRGIRR